MEGCLKVSLLICQVLSLNARIATFRSGRDPPGIHLFNKLQAAVRRKFASFGGSASEELSSSSSEPSEEPLPKASTPELSGVEPQRQNFQVLCEQGLLFMRRKPASFAGARNVQAVNKVCYLCEENLRALQAPGTFKL